MATTTVNTEDSIDLTTGEITGTSENSTAKEERVAVNWMRNIRSSGDVTNDPSYQARTSTFDIGIGALRVQGYDTYVPLSRVNAPKRDVLDLDSVDDATADPNAPKGGVLLTRWAEKRERYENNTMNYPERLEELGMLSGKRLTCSQCKSITGSFTNEDGSPACSWHMTAVVNLQLRMELVSRGFLLQLRHEGFDVKPITAHMREQK